MILAIFGLIGNVMGSRKEAQINMILHVQVDNFGTGFVRNKHPLQKCQLFDHSALFRKCTRKIRMVKSQVYTCTARRAVHYGESSALYTVMQ